MNHITEFQRIQIVSLLFGLGFDDTVVTIRFWRKLNLSGCWLYRPIDEWLDSLSVESASALIDRLQKEVA